MQIRVIVYGLGILGAIALAAAGMLYSSHKSTCVWVTFVGIVIFDLAFCLYWQNSILKSTQIREKQVELVEPTFSEDVEEVRFSLGEKGFTAGYSRSDLKERPAQPFYFKGYRPVRFYIAKGNLYADVEIYAGPDLPPLKIKRNKLIGKPPDWDMNSNQRAMEIVNGNDVPAYQLIYKTPSHIVLHGIFPFPGGVLLANERGCTMNPKVPTMFRIKRIFKYPSWKYPGEYAEDHGTE